MIITEEAKQFADSIVADLAQQVEGDPDKMKRFWRQVAAVVRKELGL
jgi:hypothetical protein